MKVEEIRGQSDQELKAVLEDLEKEIFLLRNELKVTRKLEKPHLLKDKKRTRARILTILKEKQTTKASDAKTK